MEVRYNSKISAAQIKTLATSKAAPVNSDRNASVKLLQNKKSITGVLPVRKNHDKNTPRHHGEHRYCVL